VAGLVPRNPGGDAGPIPQYLGGIVLQKMIFGHMLREKWKFFTAGSSKGEVPHYEILKIVGIILSQAISKQDLINAVNSHKELDKITLLVKLSDAANYHWHQPHMKGNREGFPRQLLISLLDRKWPVTNFVGLQFNIVECHVVCLEGEHATLHKGHVDGLTVHRSHFLQPIVHQVKWHLTDTVKRLQAVEDTSLFYPHVWVLLLLLLASLSFPGSLLCLRLSCLNSITDGVILLGCPLCGLRNTPVKLKGKL
jgi:hypothetical protein